MSRSVVIISENLKKSSSHKADKNSSNSNCKYPIFLSYSQIANHLEENLWRDAFYDFSRGIFFKGLKFDGVRLVFSIKGNKKYYEILTSNDRDERLQYYEECKKFIQENSSHFSNVETQIFKSKNEDELNLVANEKNPLESRISKQGIFIHQFVFDQCKKFGFTDEERDCLLGTINSKLCNKEITSKSLIMSENGLIEEILGLYIDEDGYFFDTEQANTVKKRKTADSTTFEEDLPQKVIPFKCCRLLSGVLKK